MWNLLVPNVILFLFIPLLAPAGTGENMSKNKHIVLDDRYQIEHGLNSRLFFKAIGRMVGKNCTTISKEIKSHLVFVKNAILSAASIRRKNALASRKLRMYATDAWT